MLPARHGVDKHNALEIETRDIYCTLKLKRFPHTEAVTLYVRVKKQHIKRINELVKLGRIRLQVRPDYPR